MAMMLLVAFSTNLLVAAENDPGTSSTPAAEVAAKSSALGTKIPDFTLRDHLGREVSLGDFAASKLVVVAFLGTDCPLVKLYSARLSETAQKYAARGVMLIGINSNRQDQPRKIGAFVQQYGITFPVLKDLDNRVADLFAAERTPEIFVLDQERAIRYRGRVDDQYGFTTSTGYGRPNLTRSDLTEALDELLAGKAVSMPVTAAPGCLIGRVPKVEPHGDVTYSKQIARIFQNHCVECHRPGEIAPFPLTNYEEVLGWGEMIQEVLDQGRMPPWHANPAHGEFRNARRLSDEEKSLIATWVKNGQPEGDPRDLPEPRVFAAGWQIPQPDLVVYMDEKPFQVPAEGVVDYIYYTVDPGFTEDKWIKAVEARPGNRSVVHHIIVSIVEPGETEQGAFSRSGGLCGYAPGMQARQYPPGVGIYVPAGSRFRFQMHYTPNGIACEDRSSVGLVFADPQEIKFASVGGVCGTVSINIPAGAPDHVIEAKQKLRKDIVLTGMMPHTHVRGRSFRYEVDYPDGTHEVLLDVPHFDFNWQLWYDLVQPKVIPKGSTIRTTAHYDNSTGNIFNPDPTKNITYGDQTWEEMMFGWYSTIEPREKVEKKK
ncbi:MAG: redoxin domain-containing protein [Planctomycetaceae bacterium]|nr:redoxin domain-containing protein [Planctomycetaceae bacterium]